MHKMQTTLTDVRGICLYFCLSHGLNEQRCVQSMLRANMRTESFGTAYINLL